MHSSSGQCNAMPSYWIRQARNPLFPTRRHPGTTSVRADSSILREIQVLWSQNYATEILRTLPRMQWAQQSVDDAMTCHHTGYDRHDIHILWNRETKEKKMKKKTKTKPSETDLKRKRRRKNRRNKLSFSPPPGDVADAWTERAGKERKGRKRHY